VLTKGCGSGSVVGTVTDCGLEESGILIPALAGHCSLFSLSLDLFWAACLMDTELLAKPASYALFTRCFPGVKRPGRGVDHPPPSSVE
jgi:hypothetical protein